MMNNLFAVTCPKNYHGGDFKVVLNQPLSVVENPYVYKKEMKRVLLEVVDSYPKVTLGYSGGSDSGFVLCCIRDLIEDGQLKKDTIDVVLCKYVDNELSLSIDTNRAIEFANSLGINPRLITFDLRKEWDNVCQHVLKSKVTMIATSVQDMIAEKIDGYFIVARRWGRKRRTGFDIMTGNDEPVVMVWNLMSQFKSQNVVDIQCWDNKIYSSLISPYTLKSKNVKMEPINNDPYCPWKRYESPYVKDWFHPHILIQETMHKWLIYLQCYPEMFEIMYKIPTFRYPDFNKKENQMFKEFYDFIQSIELNYKSGWPLTCNLEFPDGKLFTKKDLTNATDYGII